MVAWQTRLRRALRTAVTAGGTAECGEPQRGKRAGMAKERTPARCRISA